MPLGYLPASLQANFGLLVTDDGGELVELPLLPAPTNRLTREAKLTLDDRGVLSGAVEEVRLGQPATTTRSQLADASGSSRAKVLERFLATFLVGSSLTQGEVKNLDDYSQRLILNYRFVAQNYAQAAGDLLLVRPRVLGEKASALLEGKERKYPVELAAASLETDAFEITLPHGYVLDELPAPITADYPFASYSSKTEYDGKVLRYTRTFQVKSVIIPAERLSDLKKFYQQISADENSSAVFKRAAN